MRRTQLYLDADLWNALRARARSQRTTISSLVRAAARDRYLSNLDERREAMLAFIGIRKDRKDLPDSTQYVRRLRRDGRIERLDKKAR
jgi:hypothetical protein